MDGSSNERIKCTISNWTGVAYRIPRTCLEKCKERSDLKQSGVYFLFGLEEETSNGLVYVGQAGVRKNGEGILHRLQEHKRSSEKDYWTEAVVFTTQNDSFGPTEISWLENYFCTLATNVKRYVVKNNSDPNMGNVTEEKESELEEFVEYAKIIMGVLGHRLFEPLTIIAKPLDGTTISENVENNNLLYLRRKIKKSGVTVDAICSRTPEGFVVKKGSIIEIDGSDSIPPSIKNRRSNAKIDNNGILQEDMLFMSPSYAAAFVVGGHVNGTTAWVNSAGITLKELENRGQF